MRSRYDLPCGLFLSGRLQIELNAIPFWILDCRSKGFKLGSATDGKTGIKTLFAYNLQTGKVAYFPFQKLRRIVVYLQWVDKQVVASTEILSLQNFASETLLIPVFNLQSN